MRRIKTGDEVIVLAGKDKSRRGRVIKLVKDGERVLVEGINIVKKHVKPNPQKNEKGGIYEREASMHVSNVALYNSAKNKGSKIGFKNLADGRKVRYFKDTDEVIDV